MPPIGATTGIPCFQVSSSLVSSSQVCLLQLLNRDELERLMQNSDATDRSRTFGQKLMVSGYQDMLSLAWAIGGPIGNMNHARMVNAMKVPAPKQYISSAMNFPYYILTAGAAGSYRSLVPFFPKVPPARRSCRKRKTRTCRNWRVVKRAASTAI